MVLGRRRRWQGNPWGSGAGLSSEAILVKSLFERAGVAIAGRDGTLVQSGGTGATALNPATGAIVSSGGLISHSLQLNGVGSIPMFLAQGARTNLVTQSQAFDLWSTQGLAGTPVSPDTDVSPDGTSTADVMNISNTTSAHGVYRGAAATIGLTYSFTIFARAKTASLLQIGGNSTGFGINVWANFNLTSGVVGDKGSSCTASIYSVGGGWYRCTVVGVCETTTTAASGGFFAYFTNSLTSGRTPSYLGNGTDTIALWGAQLEQAAFPGVYIPNTTTALTRAYDNLVWTPPSALSNTSGEMVAVAAPYLWGNAASGNAPHSVAPILFDSSSQDVMYKAISGGTEQSSKWDVAAEASIRAASAESSGTLVFRTMRWNATALTHYLGTAASTPDSTLTLPWNSRATVTVGSRSGGVGPSHMFVGLIYVPGGLTDPERAALATLTTGALTYVG